MPAARHNANKAQLSQVMWFSPALAALAAHAEAGRRKYPDTQDPHDPQRLIPNWLLGGKPDQEYIDAALRHLAKLVTGELYDDETHTMHAAAVLWNMAALITCNYPGMPVNEHVPAPDARPPGIETLSDLAGHVLNTSPVGGAS